MESSHHWPARLPPRPSHWSARLAGLARLAVALEVEILEVVSDGVHEGLELLLGVKVRDEVIKVRLAG